MCRYGFIDHSSKLTDMKLLRPEYRILDIFAGTGAVGIEALSQNVGRAVFVDSSPVSFSLLCRRLVKPNRTAVRQLGRTWNVVGFQIEEMRFVLPTRM